MAIELIPKEQTQAEPKTYKVGDKFKSLIGIPYMLTRVSNDNEVQLTNMASGGRYSPQVKVSDIVKITADEFNKLTCDTSSDFIPTNYQLIEI